MSYLEGVRRELGEIRSQQLYRELPQSNPPLFADFSSNDYLALAGDSRMVEAMRHVKRAGSGGARLLGGAHREHALLEEELAGWLGRERALLFSSGYLAALGAIPALARFARTIYSDELNHASLIDGIRSAKLPRTIYAHAAPPARAERTAPALLVTESLFGMDGDAVDLPALVAELGEDDMLLVDEAHALGLYGAAGAGFAGGIADERVVVLGTLGKSIAAHGGFIAGPAPLIELLTNRARTFVFDTALPPALAFAARVGIMLVRSADDRRTRLFTRVRRLREGLERLGVALPALVSPIVPIVLGDERRVLEAMQRCMERGIRAPAIRPPTVPPGGSRLRISVRADHTDEQIDRLLETLACIVTS